MRSRVSRNGRVTALGDSDLLAFLAKNRTVRELSLPWQLTFSYARSLQNQVLETWRGDASKAKQASQALLHRAKLNALASRGEYAPDMERAAA